MQITSKQMDAKKELKLWYFDEWFYTDVGKYYIYFCFCKTLVLQIFEWPIKQFQEKLTNEITSVLFSRTFCHIKRGLAVLLLIAY